MENRDKLRMLGSLYNELEHVQQTVTFRDRMLLIMNLVNTIPDRLEVTSKARKYEAIWQMSSGAMTEMLMHARKTHLHEHYRRILKSDHLKGSDTKGSTKKDPLKVDSFYMIRFIGNLPDDQQVDILEWMINNKVPASKVKDRIEFETVRNIITAHILKASGVKTLKEGINKYPTLFSANYLNEITPWPNGKQPSEEEAHLEDDHDSAEDRNRHCDGEEACHRPRQFRGHFFVVFCVC